MVRRERAESATAVIVLARGSSQASTISAPRQNERKMRFQKAARQFRRHRRCISAAAVDTEPAVAAAATDADKLGWAPVREGTDTMACGAACEGRRADCLEPQ